MAEVELNIEELTVPELLALAAGISTALENNAHFPAPQPTPQELDRLAAELRTADATFRERRRLAGEAQAVRVELADRLRQALSQEADYVQEASGGHIAKILSANLHVEEETRFWPFRSVARVEDFSASAGDQPGEIDLAWDPVPGASGYEVEIAYDLTGEGPWEQSGASVHSKLTVEQLNKHTRYWFRIRAVAESGVGEWSEPLMKFAP